MKRALLYTICTTTKGGRQSAWPHTVRITNTILSYDKKTMNDDHRSAIDKIDHRLIGICDLYKDTQYVIVLFENQITYSAYFSDYNMCI